MSQRAPEPIEPGVPGWQEYTAQRHAHYTNKERPASAGRLYESLEGAVDSRRNILAEAKTFLRWCRGKGWTKVDALEHVQGLGRR